MFVIIYSMINSHGYGYEKQQNLEKPSLNNILNCNKLACSHQFIIANFGFVGVIAASS